MGFCPFLAQIRCPNLNESNETWPLNIFSDNWVAGSAGDGRQPLPWKERAEGAAQQFPWHRGVHGGGEGARIKGAFWHGGARVEFLGWQEALRGFLSAARRRPQPPPRPQRPAQADLRPGRTPRPLQRPRAACFKTRKGNFFSIIPILRFSIFRQTIFLLNFWSSP